MRDSISLSVYYGATVDLRGSLVLGLSQSGQTPDVLEYVERARARGAFTIGVTNETDSSLATAADVVLPLAAGPERAIAATKTYTNQIAALALLAGYAAERGPEVADGIRARRTSSRSFCPRSSDRSPSSLYALAFVGRMFVIGRGTEFATAHVRFR
jgi:glucosamine--fructose-6-phosphate aminotransferase (isomerizing)